MSHNDLKILQQIQLEYEELKFHLHSLNSLHLKKKKAFSEEHCSAQSHLDISHSLLKAIDFIKLVKNENLILKDRLSTSDSQLTIKSIQYADLESKLSLVTEESTKITSNLESQLLSFKEQQNNNTELESNLRSMCSKLEDALQTRSKDFDALVQALVSKESSIETLTNEIQQLQIIEARNVEVIEDLKKKANEREKLHLTEIAQYKLEIEKVHNKYNTEIAQQHIKDDTILKNALTTFQNQMESEFSSRLETLAHQHGTQLELISRQSEEEVQKALNDTELKISLISKEFEQKSKQVELYREELEKKSQLEMQNTINLHKEETKYLQNSILLLQCQLKEKETEVSNSLHLQDNLEKKVKLLESSLNSEIKRRELSEHELIQIQKHLTGLEGEIVRVSRELALSRERAVNLEEELINSRQRIGNSLSKERQLGVQVEKYKEDHEKLLVAVERTVEVQSELFEKCEAKYDEAQRMFQLVGDGVREIMEGGVMATRSNNVNGMTSQTSELFVMHPDHISSKRFSTTHSMTNSDEELDRLRREIENLKTLLDAIEEERDGVLINMTMLEGTVESQSQQILDLQSRVAELTSSFQTSQNQTEFWKNEVGLKDKQKEKLHEMLLAVEKELTDLKGIVGRTVTHDVRSMAVSAAVSLLHTNGGNNTLIFNEDRSDDEASPSGSHRELPSRNVSATGFVFSNSLVDTNDSPMVPATPSLSAPIIGSFLKPFIASPNVSGRKNVPAPKSILKPPSLLVSSFVPSQTANQQIMHGGGGMPPQSPIGETPGNTSLASLPLLQFVNEEDLENKVAKAATSILDANFESIHLAVEQDLLLKLREEVMRERRILEIKMEEKDAKLREAIQQRSDICSSYEAEIRRLEREAQRLRAELARVERDAEWKEEETRMLRITLAEQAGIAALQASRLSLSSSQQHEEPTTQSNSNSKRAASLGLVFQMMTSIRLVTEALVALNRELALISVSSSNEDTSFNQMLQHVHDQKKMEVDNPDSQVNSSSLSEFPSFEECVESITNLACESQTDNEVADMLHVFERVLVVLVSSARRCAKPSAVQQPFQSETMMNTNASIALMTIQEWRPISSTEQESPLL